MAAEAISIKQGGTSGAATTGAPTANPAWQGDKVEIDADSQGDGGNDTAGVDKEMLLYLLIALLLFCCCSGLCYCQRRKRTARGVSTLKLDADAITFAKLEAQGSFMSAASGEMPRERFGGKAIYEFPVVDGQGAPRPSYAEMRGSVGSHRRDRLRGPYSN